MTPFHDSGSAVSSRSHSTTTSSTSVRAGADCHVMPSAPSPEAARSPSTELEGRVGREPAEVARVLNLGHARDDDVFEVGQHPAERFGLLRRPARQLPRHLTRSHLRLNRQLRDPGTVIRNPVDQLMTSCPELLRPHIASSLPRGHISRVPKRCPGAAPARSLKAPAPDATRRGAHARRRLERKVIRAGHDERTRLRFSRISIARCADLIRSSASAWGPLSWSVHPVTAARATDQRPCAQDLRPGGAGSTAGLRRRETGGREPARIAVRLNQWVRRL